jgi:micrococcal nuclease
VSFLRSWSCPVCKPLAHKILPKSCCLQFDTVSDIPDSFFTNQEIIYGRVAKVTDGDTMRVRHCPSLLNCPEFDPNVKQQPKESTLTIRLYGVDCPELKKKSNDAPSQPFAQDAKDFTSQLVLGQPVDIKLLRKDQYGRAVAAVQTHSSSNADVSMELTARGLALLYKGSGAEYNGNKEMLQTLQATAKQNQQGMWSLGDALVTPGEFKRQQKELAKKQQQLLLQQQQLLEQSPPALRALPPAGGLVPAMGY